MQTLDVLRSRPHFSASQLKTFLLCPRRHAYQYLDRVEPEFRPIALAFGTAWHAAVAQYLLCGSSTEETSDLFRDVLVREVEDGSTPVLFEDDEDLGECIDLGTRMIDTFIATVPRPDLVLGVEVAFSLDIPNPRTGELDSMPLIGAIDALVIDNDVPMVWELKTGKKKWSEDQLEFDLQPTAYKMGARAHDIEDAAVKVLVTTKAKKPTVQIETVTRTARDEHELGIILHNVHTSMDHGIEHPIRGWQCKSCPYAGRCS